MQGRGRRWGATRREPGTPNRDQTLTLLPTPCSLLPIPFLLLPIPYLRLPIPYSLFPIPYSAPCRCRAPAGSCASRRATTCRCRRCRWRGFRLVIDAWVAQTAELGRSYRWVQAFENKGTIMGCSNRHPHGQIWALDALPNEPAREDRRQRAYATAEGRPLLLDYADARGRARRARGGEQRRLARRGAVLGGLAVRGAAAPEASRPAPARSAGHGAREPGERAETPAHTL